MSYIGNQPTSVAFLTDQFSGTGSQTAFTLSAAPANTASILVAVSGVLQDPTTYSTSGLTLTFSAAPPSGTGNISVRYLGIPASNIATTAYRTVTDFTATAGQTTFTPPSYTAGFINVYRNGARLGAADYTATNGTTVVLATGATAGDLVTTESFFVSSVLNAIPATNGAVTTPYILDGAVTAAKMGANGTWAPTGTVLQVVNGVFTTAVSTTSAGASLVSTGFSVTITPKSATNKILIIASLEATNTSANNCGVNVSVYRNGSNLSTTSQPYLARQYMLGGTGQAAINIPILFLDSPATTSACTYTVYYSTVGGGQAYIAGDTYPNTLVLQEIVA